jgi:hypothetical protein
MRRYNLAHKDSDLKLLNSLEVTFCFIDGWEVGPSRTLSEKLK